MKKSNEIKKKFKNYFIYFEPTIKSKVFIIPKNINSMPELKKVKKSLKFNYNPKKYVNEIFVIDVNDLILFKYDLNIKLKDTKNSNINNNIILIKKNIINILNNNSVNNSYLNEILYFHYFSIYNNNKLNQINNFNIRYQNQYINYIKIRNKKLFLRILEKNKAKIAINATESGYYYFVYNSYRGGDIETVKLIGNDNPNIDGKKIYLEIGVNIIELYLLNSQLLALCSLNALL